jgi:hypothetical protein
MCKGQMTPDAIDGNAHQFSVMMLKFWQDLIEKRYFVAAHRTPVGRIKHQHDGLPAKVMERDGLVGSGVKRKVRGWGSWPQGCCSWFSGLLCL